MTIRTRVLITAIVATCTIAAIVRATPTVGQFFTVLSASSTDEEIMRHVRIDEDALLNFVITYPAGNFVNTGEILAAAKALKAGDPAPLLRLGAEGSFTLVGDSGDPTFYSAGAYYATGCMDAIEPWDWSRPVSERTEQYDEAVTDLPFNYSQSSQSQVFSQGIRKEAIPFRQAVKDRPEPALRRTGRTQGTFHV